MSPKRIFLPLVFLLVSAGVFGQTDIINQVKEAIKAGSAKELAKFLNSTVDVTLEGNVQSYSKAQAEFVLRDFFKQMYTLMAKEIVLKKKVKTNP